jgi:hypothetical protein
MFEVDKFFIIKKILDFSIIQLFDCFNLFYYIFLFINLKIIRKNK